MTGTMTNCRKPLACLFFCCLLALITGCSQQLGMMKAHESYSLSSTGKSPPDHWRIKGKLGVRTEVDSGSVTVDWRQREDRYGIHVSGPFGRGSTRIEGNPQFIVIDQAGEAAVTSATPERLLQETLGWFIPIDDLRHWVQGLPTSDKAVAGATYNEQGMLATFEQADWLVSISRYKPVEKWLLPHRVKINKGKVQLILAIHQWQFPQSTPQYSDVE